MILLAVLVAAASMAVVVLGPLLFEVPRPELARARPWALGATVLAVVLVAAEWFGAHSGWR